MTLFRHIHRFVITGIVKQCKPLHTAVVGHGQQSISWHTLTSLACFSAFFAAFSASFCCFFRAFFDWACCSSSPALKQEDTSHTTQQEVLSNFYLPFLNFLPGNFSERWGKAFQPQLTHTGTASHWLFKLMCLSSIVSTCPKNNRR